MVRWPGGSLSGVELGRDLQSLDCCRRAGDLQEKFPVVLDRRDDQAQPPTVFLGQILAREIGGGDQPSKDGKVATVAGDAGIACVAMCSCLHHERTDEVGPPDESLAAVDRHRHDLATLQRLGPACGRQCRAAGNALALTGPLPNAVGKQHVDRGLASHPTMLASFHGDPR